MQETKAEELPKLRKTAPKEEPKEPEKKPEKPKAKVKKVKPKYEELPEIPDYERPALEKYEKSDFSPSDFSKKSEIPKKMEKPTFEIQSPDDDIIDVKHTPAAKQQIVIEEPEDRKLIMGKGVLKDDDTKKDSATLRPVIREPEPEPVPEIKKVEVSLLLKRNDFRKTVNDGKSENVIPADCRKSALSIVLGQRVSLFRANNISYK